MGSTCCWVLAWAAQAAAGARVTAHLVQEALHHDNQGEGDRVQAEEDVITVHGVHAIGVFEEKLLLFGSGEKLGGEGWPDHRTALTGLRGRAGPYLDGGHPEEADVEHAVGHEAHQVQGHEVKTQTHDTEEGAGGWGDKAGQGVRLGAAGGWRGQSSQHTGRRAWLPQGAHSPQVPFHATPNATEPHPPGIVWRLPAERKRLPPWFPAQQPLRGPRSLVA